MIVLLVMNVKCREACGRELPHHTEKYHSHSPVPTEKHHSHKMQSLMPNPQVRLFRDSGAAVRRKEWRSCLLQAFLSLMFFGYKPRFNWEGIHDGQKVRRQTAILHTFTWK